MERKQAIKGLIKSFKVHSAKFIGHNHLTSYEVYFSAHDNSCVMSPKTLEELCHV